MNLEKDIRDLAPWFHTFVINGIHTKPEATDPWISAYPENLWNMIKPLIPFDLKGKKVLDIGCNAGFFSFEMAKLGASVIGVDSQQQISFSAHSTHRPLEQASYLENNVFKLGIDFRVEDFLDIKETDFDLVLFCGVYYHMPDHKKAFPKIRSILKDGGIVITESAVADVAQAYSGVPGDMYHNDPTNYFVPSQDYLLNDLSQNNLLSLYCQKFIGNRILLSSVKAIV